LKEILKDLNKFKGSYSKIFNAVKKARFPTLIYRLNVIHANILPCHFAEMNKPILKYI
jgi:hypothetical protein